MTQQSTNVLLAQLAALVASDVAPRIARSEAVVIATLRPEIYARGGSASTFTGENKDAITLAAGTTAAVHTSGTGVVRADKGSAATLTCGLLAADVAAAIAGAVQTEGLLTLADWSAATGAPTLSGGAVYYLASGGAISITPPSSGYVQRIGRAVNSTTLDISIEQAILL